MPIIDKWDNRKSNIIVMRIIEGFQYNLLMSVFYAYSRSRGLYTPSLDDPSSSLGRRPETDRSH